MDRVPSGALLPSEDSTGGKGMATGISGPAAKLFTTGGGGAFRGHFAAG